MPPRKSVKRKARTPVNDDDDKENPDVEPYTPTNVARGAKDATFGLQRASAHSDTTHDARDARSDIGAVEDVSAHAPHTPRGDDSARDDVLARMFVEFQERFDASRDAESSALAANVVMQFSNAMDRIAHAREQLNAFTSEAHAVINEIESIVELSAQKGMGDALELCDEVEATKERLARAKHFVGLLNATTNEEPTDESRQVYRATA